MEVVRGLFRLKSWWVALFRAVVFTFPARLVPVRPAVYRAPCDFSYNSGICGRAIKRMQICVHETVSMM